MTYKAPSWDRVKQIFQQVLDQPPPERAAVLSQLCGGDSKLRNEVNALLAAHADAGSFCDQPVIRLPPIERPEPSTLAAGTRLGHYEIVRYLASGGMGEVYRAIDTRLGRPVAIKLLSLRYAQHREMRGRFDREAHAVARLNHRHICTLLDVGHTEDRDYLVFEYLEGETLAQRLVHGPLAFPDLLRTAEEVLSALDHAHRNGVIHRDLKPTNILVTPEGIKLCDFGLAVLKKVRHQAEDPFAPLTQPALTTEREIIGTLQYMSPEQLEGLDADERSDIFSLGAVMYEMATGEKAFAARSEAGLIAAVLTSQPPPLIFRRPLTPPFLDHTIQRCLAKAPTERWQSARDLLAVIRSDGATSSPDVSSNIRLNSWKEIAAYLQCGVRTVQRWEKTERLPIHRHLHQTQGSIYAFTREIDDWRSRRGSGPVDGAAPASLSTPNPAPIVGRVSELARLEAHWSTVLTGTRQVVFVAGTIGVGKTALVRAFLERLDSAWVIQGESVEQYGSGEPYLPVIEGLARLVRGSRNQTAVSILAKYAPSWVIHIPDFPGPYPNLGEPRPDRMARELIDALDVLSQNKPVVLFLEDLHWADRSTVEFVDRIARRRERARILVILTHRLEESADREPSLMRTRHELHAHGLCHQLRVRAFSEEETSEYLRQRGIWADLQGVARQLHESTGGVPLFISVLVEDLLETKRLTLANGAWILNEWLQKNTPLIAPTIRHLIEDRFRRLAPDEQQLLEASSVAGPAFFAAVIAAAMRVDLTHVEQILETLARRHQFIERSSSDESLGDLATGRYAFLHSLYQHVIYDRLSPSTRADLHGAMGLFLEQLYRSGREDLAAELAMHFERSLDFQRAALYYDASAAMALGRGANHEAHAAALRALDQFAKLPGNPERVRHELSVRLKICAALSNISTMADPQVEQAYGEALALCERLGDDAQIVPALLGIGRFHTVRGNVETGRNLGERALNISRVTGDSVFLVQTLQHLAVACDGAGRFAEAHAYATEAVDVCCAIPTEPSLLTSGFHPGPAALTVQSWVFWVLGHPDQACQSARDAVALATKLSHPQTLAYTNVYAALTLEVCGICDQSQSLAETALALAKQCELVFAVIFAEGVLGWILGRRGSKEGAKALSRSIELQSAVGVNFWIPQMSAWLAENLLHAGQLTDAAVAVNEGLKVARQLGVTAHDAELIGLRAELLAASARVPTSTGSIRMPAEEPGEVARQSYSIAAAQQARSYQLRAAMRLLRLATTSTHIDEAYELLSKTYASFSEGLDTPDLREARALLVSMRRSDTAC